MPEPKPTLIHAPLSYNPRSRSLDQAAWEGAEVRRGYNRAGPKGPGHQSAAWALVGMAGQTLFTRDMACQARGRSLNRDIGHPSPET